MPIKDYQSSILVSGSHRSGSTWLGQMLSLGDTTSYLHEPFNIGLEHIKNLGCPLDHTFQYVTDKDPSEFLEKLKKYLDKADKQLTKKNEKVEQKDLIIKDPIAMMSGKWFEDQFGSKVIMLIRHPAAFVASLKLKSWYFDFSNYLKQDSLMDEVLFPYRSQIELHVRRPQDIISQGILLWNIIYYRIRLYELSHPNWFYLKHEDLSRTPLIEIEKLYKNLGLNYSEGIKQKVEEAVKPKVTTEFKRDSKANIFSWKERLTTDEISKIKDETWEISDLYYGIEDWDPDGDDTGKSENAPVPELILGSQETNQTFKYNIESINGVMVDKMDSLNVHDEHILIKGWALNISDANNVNGIFLKIGSRYFEVVYGYPRADVARLYKNKDIVRCGFELSLSCKKLAKGKNPLSLIIVENEFYSEQKFHLNIIIN